MYEDLSVIRIAKYKRKSTETEERQVLSIPAQDDWAREEIERIKRTYPNKKVIVTIDIEEEKSAKAPGRPGFNELMTAFSNWEADIIVTWKLNRLSRNPIDEGTIKWLCQDFTIKAIHSIDWISTGHNILLMSVHFWMATQYVIDLSKDVLRWMRQKAKNGGWGHLAPLWYKNVNSEIEIDTETAPIIKRIFELKEQNVNDTEIAEIANNLWLRTKPRKIKGVSVGNKKITNKTIARIISNPFYYGVISHIWEIFEWKHTPIITKETFDKVNAIEKKFYIKHKVWFFKWIVKDFETWKPYNICKKYKTLKSWKKLEYIYYFKRWIKWKHKSIWFSEIEILNKLKHALADYELPQEFVEDFKSALFEYHWMLQDKNLTAQENINKIISDLEKTKEWFTIMRANNELTHEEYLEKKNKIVEEIISNRERLKDIDRLSGEIMTKVSNFVELLSNLSIKGKTLDTETLALLGNLIFAELKIDHEKRLHIAEKPLFQLIKSFKNVNWWVIRDSNPGPSP